MHFTRVAPTQGSDGRFDEPVPLRRSLLLSHMQPPSYPLESRPFGKTKGRKEGVRVLESQQGRGKGGGGDIDGRQKMLVYRTQVPTSRCIKDKQAQKSREITGTGLLGLVHSI